MFGFEDRSVALCLQVQARRAGRTEVEDQGHLPEAGALWLPPCSRRDGWPVNPKRIYRLYKEMDLQPPKKVPKRRVKAKLRAGRTEAAHSNHVCNGLCSRPVGNDPQNRVLTVVDTFSRFSPAVEALVAQLEAAACDTSCFRQTRPLAPPRRPRPTSRQLQ